MIDREIIAAMRDTITRNGWTKHWYGREDTSVCVAGAYRVVTGDHSLWFYGPGGEPREWGNTVAEAVARAVTELFPGRAESDHPWVTIIVFNDHEDTTVEDVELVLKHAEEG